MRKALGFLSIIFLILVIAASLNPFRFLRGMALITPYNTQTIKYRNIDNPDVTIEYKMKDVGGRGHLKRTVQVELDIFWDSVREVDPGSIDKRKWREVNVYVNEHGLRVAELFMPYSHNKPRQADQIYARSSLQFSRCAGRYV